jgi:N-acetylglucosaminyldiphosphoundecaprenol N-acetyl-beta-D-mannosaminyltransferase
MGLAPFSRFNVAGVPIDGVDLASTLRWLEAALGERRRLQVCTVNTDFLVHAQSDAELKNVLQHADLNIPDGFPVVMLGRVQGVAGTGKVTGTDIVAPLMKAAARQGSSVFLLGGEHGIAAEAGRRLQAAEPDLVVAGCHEPPRAPIEAMDNDAIVARINKSGADVLLVALGNPKQDKWIARHKERLRVSLAIGVGCTLDVVAGRLGRAPRWMQTTGFEWLYRLSQEPGYLASRYARDLAWLILTAWPMLVHRHQAVSATAQGDTS